jgi:hypothetical protein
MNCYGLNRFGPIEKKERAQNVQEQKEMEDKLAALLAARKKQDSIWIPADQESKKQTASFSKKPKASS